MNSTIKKVIIIVVIIVLVILGASFFVGGSTAETPLQSATTGNTASPLSQNVNNSATLVDTEQINREFLSVLLNLQSIKLNDDIFSEPAFNALVNNTVKLNQPGNEGRSNPFAPIGVDALSANAISADQSIELDPFAMQDPIIETPIPTQEGPADGPIAP